MARFSAITSDSSDEEEEVVAPKAKTTAGKPTNRLSAVEDDDEDMEDEEDDEDEHYSEDERSTGSSSDMVDDELRYSPRHSLSKRAALESTHDDEGDYMTLDELSRSSSGQGQPINTSITPWARSVGVDPQKMHVMQTSLFRAPEEAAAMKAAAATRRTPQITVESALGDKRLAASAKSLLTHLPPQQRTSFNQDAVVPAYRPSRKYARVDGAASQVAGSEGCYTDAGLAFGRSFRVGWGPEGSIVHLGQLCGPSTTTTKTANSSVLSISHVPLMAKSKEEAVNFSTPLLQHHLSNSPITPDSDGVPAVHPSSSLTFSAFATLYPPDDPSYAASLFRLGEALFDPLDLQLSETVTVDIRNRVTALRRRVGLSNWLKQAVAPTVEMELRTSASSHPAAAVFTYLTGHAIDKACEVAMNNGLDHLATLVSQGGGDADFKDDLREQLSIWQQQRIDIHIDDSVLKTYALLASVLDVLDGSSGTGIEAGSDIDVVEGLDWKRVFGLLLWYSEPIDMTVAQVFQTFSDMLKKQPSRISSSRPAYTQEASAWKISEDDVNDAGFSLIRLYADPACSLSQILHPSSFGPSPVDYSLPWHLYIILSRCMRVRDVADRDDSGTKRLDEDEDERREGRSLSADLLTSSYASQLEQLGLVQEALFVLLHLEGSSGRRQAIQDMLSRNAHLLDEWVTRGVIGSLKIPLAWVNEAKALYALSTNNVYEAYELYLEARLFPPAHDLAVLELAPEAIVRQDLELLSDLFDRISGHLVPGWETRGKTLLDYVHILTRLPVLEAELKNPYAVPDAAQASEFDELVRSIPKLITILPEVLRDRSDIRHNAALSEMNTSLMTVLDRVRPLVMTQSQVRPLLLDEATRLRHIQASAYESFLKSIEVAA